MHAPALAAGAAWRRSMPHVLSEDARRRSETLFERIDRIAPAPARPADEVEIERALAPWRRAASRGDGEAFGRRLAWGGIPREVAARAMAGDPEPPEIGPAVAGWLEEVAAAAMARPDRPNGGPGPRDLPFVELIDPWLEVAEARLRRLLPRWDASFSREASESWLAGLARRLGWIAALPCYSRFARVREVDRGDGIYRRWVSSELSVGTLGIYEEHPRLAIQLGGRAADWLEASAELLGRLEDDCAALALRFDGGRDPGRVASLETGLSDPHARGRRVVALRFESGLEVVYKPRPVELEAWFEELVADLERAGLENAPPAIATLVREGYGWQERIVAEEVEEEEEVERWFRVAGALAAIGWVFGARDLHAENLVATRGGPALVDAEMLLAPRTTASAAIPERVEGVFATGLLADPAVPVGPAAPGYAGLAVPDRAELPQQDRRWRNVGTDAVQLELVRTEAPVLANVLRRAGRPQRPEGYAAAVCEGFERAARRLAREASRLAGPGGILERARGARTRILFRPSAQYADILALLVQPSYLADGIAASLLLEPLLRVFAPQLERPALWPLVADERAALERLDVPAFRLPVEATTLHAEDGQPAQGWLALSGLEAARQRLGRLDERAIARELGDLRRALAPRRRTRATEEGELGAAAATVAAALARSEAFRVGARAGAGLRELALYGGVAGRALFAAGAFRATGDATWRDLAARLAASIEAALDPGGIGGEDRDRPGGTDGWGSLIWTFVALAELLEEPSLLGGARLAAAALERTPVASERWGLDLAAGEAGAVLGLLALAESGDDEALGQARRRGRTLVTSAATAGGWPPPGGGPALAGLAHGAAGVARALDALARATGEASFRELAERGRDYERSLFDARRGDWPILVRGETSGRVERRWLASWCHGAPGIALERASRVAHGDDATARGELRAALETIENAPLPEVDHLCCGSAGRITALGAAGLWLRDEAALAAARGLARRALARAESRGEWAIPTGGPGGEPAELGFFRGFPGLAWSLVALTPAGEPLPVVAALELPSERRRRTLT